MGLVRWRDSRKIRRQDGKVNLSGAKGESKLHWLSLACCATQLLPNSLRCNAAQSDEDELEVEWADCRFEHE
jgi:hypothetical protein